ncbi:MAG: UDP-N-acetylmuramate dehydrogenase [Gammaproteobacteria bacterium]|nr:UDP-N-acetylmuramate dehydrogenase [Gammaproteobacteria bacterium]
MTDNIYIPYEDRMRLRGELSINEPLSRYTSWRVGGKGRYLYKPTDIEDLAFFLFLLPEDEPVTWFGAGTNLLVRDKGISGTVIVANSGLDYIEIVDPMTVDRIKDVRKMPYRNAQIIRAEAGASSVMLAHFCLRLSLTGLEFLAGIPGTVGGALKMNAGAFGGQTWDHVIAVETMNRFGRHRLRAPEEFDMTYRAVTDPDQEWFVAGYFELEKGNQEASHERIQAMLERRRKAHPLNLPNAGSVFRNPEGDYAARLIETAGLKGYRIGGASVSHKHANFIVNDQNATASDIEQLIEYIIKVVEDKHGVQLQKEIHIVGGGGINN